MTPSNLLGIPAAIAEDAQFLVDDIVAQMQTDLDVFAGIALPEECTEPFSDLHHNAWALMTASVLSNKRLDKYAIAIPRGHAKTLLLKLLCLFIILFTKRRFILVLCTNATLAGEFISDVCDLLDGNNIIELFGDWRADITTDNEKKKKFHFRGRDIIIKPQGVGGGIRGTNIKFVRPDIIICDDVQSLEDSENPEVSRKLLKWFLGTLLKARSPKWCTVIYLGNMYPDIEMGERGGNLFTCLLRNLMLIKSWMTWVTGAILADGTALWEAVHPLEALLEDLRQDTELGEAAIWYAEVQNDPSASSTKHLDPDKIPTFPYNELDLVIGKFIVIDPSLGKKKSDDQIVGLFYVYDDKGPVLMELRNIQKSAPELVEEVIIWALKEGVPLVTAESVAYQATLLQWFAFWFDRLQIEGIQLAGVTPKGMSKPSRILAYFKSLMAGRSMCHPIPLPLITSQAQFYQPAKPNNIDDMLDVGAYGEDVFLQHSDAWVLPLEGITSNVVDTVIPDNTHVEETNDTDWSAAVTML